MPTQVTFIFCFGRHTEKIVVLVGGRRRGLDAAYEAFSTVFRGLKEGRLEMYDEDGIGRIFVNSGRNHREWLKSLIIRIKIEDQ